MAWYDFLNPIKPITDLVGAKMQSNAVRDAAKIEAQTADKALAENKRIFDLQRSDTGPYRTAGVNSVGAMSSLLGLPDPGGVPTGPTPAGTGGALSTFTARNANPGMSYGQPGDVQKVGEYAAAPQNAASASSYVTIASPTGQTKQVPAGEVNHWISKGGKVVA